MKKPAQEGGDMEPSGSLVLKQREQLRRLGRRRIEIPQVGAVARPLMPMGTHQLEE